MRRLRAALAFALLGAAGCTTELPPQRDCTTRIWVRRGATAGAIEGTWNAWQAELPETYDAQWNVLRVDLPPGEHGYLIDGALDPENPLSTYDDDGRQVSFLEAADCSQPRVELQRVAYEGGELVVEALFLATDADAPLDAEAVNVTTRAGQSLEVTVTPEDGRIVARGAAPAGRHRVELTATDVRGAGATADAALWTTRRDPRDDVLYQVMIDRFRASDGSALPMPEHAAARAGGTLDGVTSAIDDGTLAQVGATAVWLSPAYVNPDEPRLGDDGQLYTSYHGYWPVDSRGVDARIGGEAALDHLVDRAHGAGLAVLLDVVPNHVYEDNPLYGDHADAGWFSAGDCVCGSESCPWGGNIEHCWFTPYLPDVRWQNRDAARAIVDDVVFWPTRFDLDGVRIDAVPMMPRSATRRLAHALRGATHPSASTFLLGEIYTGPGPLAIDQLRYQFGPAGLDSAFDFPLMWALHDAIARGQGNFEAVDAVLAYEEAELEGSGAVLARIVDNHDTPRFVSVATGDGAADPWANPPAQPSDADPYRRLELALAINFTLPGMPVIYQGDEIGLAGANDPDSRRVMPSEAELNEHQKAVRETVSQLASVRRCSAALRRGTRTTLSVAPHAYTYLRDAGDGDRAIVLVHTGAEATTLSTAGAPAGAYVDALSGEALSLDASGDVAMEPLSFRILLPAGSACATP